jgi:hypothetical protein
MMKLAGQLLTKTAIHKSTVRLEMRKNSFAVWAIIAVVIFEQSAFARIAFRHAHSDQSTNFLPYAGSRIANSHHKPGIVRVTDDKDGVSASAPSSPGFNLDATRFFVMLDRVATLYIFDPSSLEIEKQGPLFDRTTLQADGAQWSAADPDTVFALDDADGAIRLEAYDVRSRSLTPIKDFSDILAKGEARGLSKSWSDDNRFAFTYREAGATDWHYVIVWDRLTDSLYQFDTLDAASGVAGFADASLDRSGELLIVNGDVTRAWRYLSQPQHEATLVEPKSQEMAPASSHENDSRELMNLINASPDRLPRNNVSRDGRFTIFNSSANGSRSDVFIATANEGISGTANLMWTNILNCTANENTLQKTGGNDQSDDARATSVQSIKSGDAYIEFTAKETNKDRWCGLNNSNAIHQEAEDINFAIKLNSKKKAMVTENGSVKAKIKYKANNVFRIAIESGVVNYYKNGSVFYTSSARPVYPLLVNASLMHSMASVSNVMINGAGFGPVVSISPAKAILNAGGTIQFTAIITAVNSEPVNWSATGGNVTSGGVYTAPNAAGTYTVTAASASDPAVKASASITVTGAPDTTPPVISAVTATNVTASSAVINWTTNEPSDTQVEYGTSTSYGSLSTQNPTLVTSHSVAFAGLASGTLYHYRARSKDAGGNVSVSSDFTFTTSGGGGDTTPPVISAISATSITTSSATITWTTNEVSDTQVEYGATTGYGSSTQVNTTMVTSHTATLSGLNANTLYHYRVKSRDAAGNLASSGDQTFTTAANPGGGGGGTVITDKNVYLEPPPPALPAAGGTFRDPVFGTTIMRVTDERDGAFNVTNYSYYPSFNKNSTRLFIIAGGEGSLYQFDPVNFRISNKRRLFTTSMPGGGYPGSEDAIWSGTDPDVIYCHAFLKIYAYNVVTNQYTLIRDFAGQLPGNEIMQMSKSIDDNAFGFHLRDASYRNIAYAAWQRSQNSLYRVDTSDVNEVQVDKSGQYLYVITETSGPANAIEGKVVNLQTRQVIDLTDGPPDYAPGHKDMGSGYVIGGENWRNSFLYRPLSNPHQFRTVISMGNDWSVGSHISLMADNEDWVTIGTFVANDLPSNKLYRNELFQVSTDGSERVRRLAHIHSVYRDYWDTPRATISRDGRFAAFTSNWGSTTRRDVFLVLVPLPGSGGGGGGGGDTTSPSISAIASSNVTANSATITWATNEVSDTQVEYGATTGYGSSTQVNTTMVTSHTATLSGLNANTLYHYRVKSRDAAGNLASSGDLTFTTAGSGGGGGGTRQNVNWISIVNCATTSGALQKNGGRDDSPDAGAVSQQKLTSGDGYLEFTAVETNKTRFCGLTRNPSGTEYAAIDFAIKLQGSGIADVRENNVYKGETTYRSGDVFRISVESGVVKYYKNGSVFYTSARPPTYPLVADASLINVSGTVGSAAIAATTGTLAADFTPESFEVNGKTYMAFGSSSSGKNWPQIFSPLAMTGTPSSNGAFEADFTPSRKTFITVARRAVPVVFAKEPCIIRG